MINTIKRFQGLRRSTEKAGHPGELPFSSCFEVSITYSLTGKITLQLGTGAIGHWPRFTTLGPFDNEVDAERVFNKVIDHAIETIVEHEEWENMVTDIGGHG